MDPDLELLAQRIAGSRDLPAEEALCHSLAPRIRLYLRKHLRDLQAADDLTQDALVVVLGALRAGRVEDPAKVAAFALGTCRMLVRDAVRSVRRRTGFEGRAAELAPLATGPDDTAPDLERVARCLSTLPERERQVIRLTFWEQRKAGEVAALLGTTAGNVRVIRHRALGHLEACVGGAEVVP